MREPDPGNLVGQGFLRPGARAGAGGDDSGRDFGLSFGRLALSFCVLTGSSRMISPGFLSSRIP